MKFEDLKTQCIKQQEILGEEAVIVLRLPGRSWGKRNTVRLWKGGPVGDIVSDDFSVPKGVIAMFQASDVLTALALAQPVDSQEG